MNRNNYRTTIRISKNLKEMISLIAKYNHISLNQQVIELLEYAINDFIKNTKLFEKED
ncbi:MAG: toxin-antitoxin system HicB family antitoxin [bacterium]|nr:toxin-antitoxin system HicB family antitoxin [bacterium]